METYNIGTVLDYTMITIRLLRFSYDHPTIWVIVIIWFFLLNVSYLILFLNQIFEANTFMTITEVNKATIDMINSRFMLFRFICLEFI